MALDPTRLLKPVKKVRKLIRNFKRQPAPEEVHQFRTSTRRIEAALEALSLDAGGAGQSVMKHLTRCRKRAGKVRDMDVLTAYASSVHVKGEDECSCAIAGESRRPAPEVFHETLCRSPAASVRPAQGFNAHGSRLRQAGPHTR